MDDECIGDFAPTIGGRLRDMRRFGPPIGLVLILSAMLSGCSACYSAPSTNGAEVIVASRDLPPGITVQEADIKIIKIPWSDLPPHTPRRKSDVLGHKTLVPIAKGEFILSSGVSGQAQDE